MAVGVPTGIKNLQLAGYDVGRQDPVQDADVVCIGLFIPVLIAGLKPASCWLRRPSIGSHGSYFVVAHFH